MLKRTFCTAGMSGNVLDECAFACLIMQWFWGFIACMSLNHFLMIISIFRTTVSFWQWRFRTDVDEKNFQLCCDTCYYCDSSWHDVEPFWSAFSVIFDLLNSDRVAAVHALWASADVCGTMCSHCLKDTSWLQAVLFYNLNFILNCHFGTAQRPRL